MNIIGSMDLEALVTSAFKEEHGWEYANIELAWKDAFRKGFETAVRSILRDALQYEQKHLNSGSVTGYLRVKYE